MSADQVSSTESIIYVRLLDEGVEVWRPVKAFRIGGMMYEIAPADIDRELETWEFWPGDKVRVETMMKSDGPLPVAVAKLGS